MAQETAGVLSRLQRIGHIPINEVRVWPFWTVRSFASEEAQVVIGFHTGPRFHWNLDDDFLLERESRFVVLQPVESGQKKARIGDGSASLASRLATVSSAVEAVDLVGVAIAKKLSEIFMLPVDDIALTNKSARFGLTLLFL